MTTTQQSAPRFTLDEDKASEFIERGTADYNPGSPANARITALLVHHAVDEGVIVDPLHRDAVTLAFEYVGACDESPHGYRWLLSVSSGDGPEDYLTVASPAADLPGISIWTGRSGAYDVLTEAVAAGNILAGELAAYVSSLPLAARAPEIGELLAAIKRDALTPPLEPYERSDAIAELVTQWLDANGYEMGEATQVGSGLDV